MSETTSQPGGEARRTSIMCALELALDVAYHDGTQRDLAVAAEAWTLAGFWDGSIMVSHSGRKEELMDAVAAARKGRPKRLLRADARGMVAAIGVLVDSGIVTCRNTMEAKNERWKARGGHER